MQDKKAQGMSINVIVVAAVALLVMIVLIAIFGQEMWQWVGQKDSCEARGGTCDHGNTECKWPSIEIKTAICENDAPCCANFEREDG